MYLSNMNTTLQNKVVNLILILLLITEKIDAILKITKVECVMEDKEFGEFEYCRLKAVKRDVAEFSMKIVLYNPVYDCTVNYELLRKYNTFKPFLLNYTLDGCAFLKERRGWKHHNVFYNMFKSYSNMNHSCPYKDNIIIDRLVVTYKDVLLPLPSGDYLLKTNWFVGTMLRLRVNVWCAFQEMGRL